MERMTSSKSNEWQNNKCNTSSRFNKMHYENEKVNEISHPTESSSEECESEDLENLPEYERELILAKRHEELVRKQQRFILLKNINKKNEDLYGNLNNKGIGRKNETDIVSHGRVHNKESAQSKRNLLNKNRQLLNKKKTQTSKLIKGTVKSDKKIKNKKTEKKTKPKTKQKKNDDVDDENEEQFVELTDEIDEKGSLMIKEEDEKSFEVVNGDEVNKFSYNEWSAQEDIDDEEEEYEEEDSKTDDSSDFLPSDLSELAGKGKKKIKSGGSKMNKLQKKTKTTSSKQLNKKIRSNLHNKTGTIIETPTVTTTKSNEIISYKKSVPLEESIVESEKEIKRKTVNNEPYGSKIEKTELLINKNVKNEHNIGFNIPPKSLHSETFESRDGLYTKKNTTERLVHLYKEEKQMKLDIYKYMTYEAISCFQLKKSFLLDMSEHIYFARFVNGHIVKIVNPKNLVKIENLLKTESNENMQNGETMNETKVKLDRQNNNNIDTSLSGKEVERRERDFSNSFEKTKSSGNINENENNIKNVTVEERKGIFFITNIIKSENYFCLDRYANIKFEITHLENINHMHFFDYLRDSMIKNKKLTLNMIQVSNYEKFICDMNDISDENISVDEYNYIKLYTVDVELLKQFSFFIREKIEDLKKFHYTEKQIQDLVEMKKRKSLYEIFMNNTNVESLSISRVTIQKEICSLLREIDTLNYSKRHIKKEDIKSLEAIDGQIELLTKRIEKFRQLLEQSRKNVAAPKRLETQVQNTDKGMTNERDSSMIKEKEFLKGKVSTDRVMQISGERDISMKRLADEVKNVSKLYNYINAENKNFQKSITKRMGIVPIQAHHNICKHFLLKGLEHDLAFQSNEIKKEEHPFQIFEIPIKEYVMTLDEVKRQYESCER